MVNSGNLTTDQCNCIKENVYPNTSTSVSMYNPSFYYCSIYAYVQESIHKM